MKIYFLFGEDAVDNYESGELNMVEHDDYCTFAYDTETSMPQELLSAYDGWGAYCEISEEDYEYLTMILNNQNLGKYCDNCGNSNGYSNSSDEFQCLNCGHFQSDN